MAEEAPTASLDTLEKAELERGYREQMWDGHPYYLCVRDPCWMGTYSRANTFDEGEIVAHVTSAHAGQ